MEDWMPDDDDIDVLLNIDNEITSKRESRAPPRSRAVAEVRAISPQKRGPPQEDFVSDDDSSDGEENLELALEQSQNDADVVKRLRHRLISRRSRHKKKRELIDLADTVLALERQYHALQSSFPSLRAEYSTHSPSSTISTTAIASKQSDYRRLLQQADQLRNENITLQAAIEKHRAFASSVQASTASAETWTLGHIHSMTVCDFASFRPLSQDQYHDKLARMLSEMAAFRVSSSATTHDNYVDGWTDRREVAQTTRVCMSSSKSVPASDVDGIFDRTWQVLTHAGRLGQVLPFLRKLDVLQTLPPSPAYHRAAVLRRDFQFPRHGKTKLSRVHYTTLLVVWQKGPQGHVLSSRTIDQPVTEHALGEGETWVDELIQYVVSIPLLRVECAHWIDRCCVSLVHFLVND